MIKFTLKLIMLCICFMLLLFCLDYFRLMPSDELLSMNKINYIQKRHINEFSEKILDKERENEKHPFTSKAMEQK